MKPNALRPLRTRLMPSLKSKLKSSWRLGLTLVAVAAVTPALTACVPLLMGGAVVGTGLLITDRRTTGAQVEDRAIEGKAFARVRDLATLGRVNLFSYNRLVLITGSVPVAEDRARVERAVATVENVRSVVNELAVGSSATGTERTQDGVLEAKVKASFVDAKDLHATAFRVIAEQGKVYLMGRVTEREAARAADVARSVPGVLKVVRVFEIVTEAELDTILKGNVTPTR
jgi:osmotically-inducible protein OsmY